MNDRGSASSFLDCRLRKVIEIVVADLLPYYAYIEPLKKWKHTSTFLVSLCFSVGTPVPSTIARLTNSKLGDGDVLWAAWYGVLMRPT